MHIDNTEDIAARILLVENSKKERDYCRKFLEGNGFYVDAVPDVQGALQKIAEQPGYYHVVVTCYMLGAHFKLIDQINSSHKISGQVPPYVITVNSPRISELNSELRDIVLATFSIYSTPDEVLNMVKIGAKLTQQKMQNMQNI